MGAIGKYIFRQTGIAFLGGLVILTVIVLVTQILSEIDLVTNKGQTVWLFFGIAGLLVPMLMMIIAPIALFAASVQTLNKLNGDSELIVLAASGMSPAHLMRPAVALAGLTTVFVAILSLWLAPMSIRHLRETMTKVQANVIAGVVKPGQFTTVDRNLTFHVKDRASGGILIGVVVSDKRDPKYEMAYVADRGVITEMPQGTFLVLEQGNLQRRELATGETAIVVFQRYALDLSQFSRGTETTYRPSERYTWELMAPDPNDPLFKAVPGRFRQELHDRLAAPLYPLALVLVAYAMLGRARTTRQSRGWSIVFAIGAMVWVRGLGFAVSALAVNNAYAVPLIYLVPIVGVLFYGAAALGYFRIEPPNWLENLPYLIGEAIARRFPRKVSA